MNKTAIGDRIREIRKNHKISQSELAKQLGVTTASVLSWEKGQKKISIDHLYKLANLYDIDLNLLILGEEQKKGKIKKVEYETLSQEQKMEIEDLRIKYQKLLEEHIELYSEFRKIEKKVKN